MVDPPLVLHVSLDPSLTALLRRSFPAKPQGALHSFLRQRGRVLMGTGGVIVEPLPGAELADSAFTLGQYPATAGVMVHHPADEWTLADRVLLTEATSPEAAPEIIPDLLLAPTLLDTFSPAAVTSPTVWHLVQWLSLRVAPHRWLVVGIPEAPKTEARDDTHRRLHLLVQSFVEAVS